MPTKAINNAIPTAAELSSRQTLELQIMLVASPRNLRHLQREIARWTGL